ncbi:RNA-binding domain-containing protein [Massilia sp. W12]|uniref:RNA-binding domain-containing protein n=1 Tax=Massilia sp. W12 TaxID=3126507 RepID=UPI0030CA8D43
MDLNLMSSILPINIDHLLRFSGVESSRVEFKASWDEKTSGQQIIQTICAFANDFQNINGGYIVLGVAEQDGAAQLPAKGLTEAEIDLAQKWIRGHCNKIDPVYQPVLSPELHEGRRILVIWAPGSQTRPHQAPEESGSGRRYYIRLGAQTVEADRYPELRTQLMQLTARVPFDDRRALQASVLDIRETKVREFLHDIDSGLVDEIDTKTLYRALRIAEPVNGHDAPRNAGLLFFSQNPEQWFPGARIEVVQFTGDATGNVLEEKIFKHRPLHEQLRECLAYLENLSVRMIQKLPGRTQAGHWVSYPLPALREALVNAVYHRSYEDTYEPTKVYLYPDRMEIISYPGPVPGIELRHLHGDEPIPPVPARNRRIGEFLKELKLAEGRGTGIPKVRRTMAQNGSPPPRFDFDEARSFFRVTLGVHPEYQAILTLQDVAHLRAIGDKQGALQRLRDTFSTNPTLLGVALELAKELITQEDISGAENVFASFNASGAGSNPSPLITLIAGAWLEKNKREKAIAWLDRLPLLDAVGDAFHAAIQEKRAGRFQKAHRYFELAGTAVLQDAKALHEFAQVKMKLAAEAHKQSPASNRRLLSEAKDMLQRVLQMDVPLARQAWAWYDLSRLLRWQKAPAQEIRHAIEKALACDPHEAIFADALKEFNRRQDSD